MNYEGINFDDFEDVDFLLEKDNNFKFTKEGERVVEEFLASCKKRQNELSDITIKLPTADDILEDIKQTVIVREDPRYVSDWNVTGDESLQIVLTFRKHFVRA